MNVDDEKVEEDLEFLQTSLSVVITDQKCRVYDQLMK